MCLDQFNCSKFPEPQQPNTLPSLTLIPLQSEKRECSDPGVPWRRSGTHTIFFALDVTRESRPPADGVLPNRMVSQIEERSLFCVNRALQLLQN